VEHEPFTHWILEGAPLSQAEQDQLLSHIDGCESCRALAAGWSQAKAGLDQPEWAKPEAGFVSRWKLHLAETRERRQKRQVRWTLAGAAGGALLAFAMLLFPMISAPAGLIGEAMERSMALSLEIRTVAQFAFGLLATLPKPLGPLPLYIGLTILGLGLIAVYTGMGAIWTASLYRLVLQPQRNGGRQ
jgi:hypothetical protein